jgi:hypothetical protein
LLEAAGQALVPQAPELQGDELEDFSLLPLELVLVLL